MARVKSAIITRKKHKKILNKNKEGENNGKSKVSKNYKS